MARMETRLRWDFRDQLGAPCSQSLRWGRMEIWLMAEQAYFCLLSPTASFSSPPVPSHPPSGEDLRMLKSNRKCQPQQCLTNTFILVGVPWKAKWHFPEGPWAKPPSVPVPPKEELNVSFWCDNPWTTSLLSAVTVLLFQQGGKKEEAKGKDKMKKVVKEQGRWWGPFIYLIHE